MTWTQRVEIWAHNNTSQTVIHEATNATVTAFRAVKAVTMTSNRDLEVWTTISGAGDTAILDEHKVTFWG